MVATAGFFGTGLGIPVGMGTGAASCALLTAGIATLAGGAGMFAKREYIQRIPGEMNTLATTLDAKMKMYTAG